MDLALQKRRLAVAMTVTAICVIVALAAVVGSFAFHLGWAMWVFVGAVVVGFGSHGWLMLGALRDRSGTS
jgi:hypothetical protein